jgi:hypothetical protein
MNMKKTVLAAAVATAVGIPATASADSITMTFGALFTMINASGAGVLNNTDSTGAPGYGFRTPVTGTASFDLGTGAGSAVITPFSFFGSGVAATTGVTFQAIGDGAGGAGNLILGNMGFSWNGTVGIPVSIVFDATGFFGAGGDGYSTSEIISGSGSLAWSESFAFDFGVTGTYTLPMGPSPMVTTSFNTTTIGGAACTIGCNPSGTLPLSDDGIGGNPMVAGPFPGFNANFDFTSIHIESFTPTSAVPVPAAVWLFGSGLMGLVGVARRRKNKA